MDLPALYNTKTVAEYLQVSPHTVRQLHRNGELKGFKIGNQLKFREEDILKYMEEAEKKSGSIHFSRFHPVK